MTPFTVALPLLFALHAQPAPPVHNAPAVLRDGNDARHLVVSFGAVTHGSAALRWIGLDRDAARWSAVGMAAALGIGKELWDVSRGNRIDPLDLVWDAVGITLGALLAGATR